MKIHRMRRQEGCNEIATSLQEPGGIETRFLKILRCWTHEKHLFGRRARKNHLGANLVLSNAFLIFAECKLQANQAAHVQLQILQTPASCFYFPRPQTCWAESLLLLLSCSGGHMLDPAWSAGHKWPVSLDRELWSNRSAAERCGADGDCWGVSFPPQSLAHPQTQSSHQLCSIALCQGQGYSGGLRSICNKCALLEKRSGQLEGVVWFAPKTRRDISPSIKHHLLVTYVWIWERGRLVSWCHEILHNKSVIPSWAKEG